MSALPGLAILLLATIGAARVVKVSLTAIRSAVRYVRDVHREVSRRRAARIPEARVVQAPIDRDAIVRDVMARLVEYRGGTAREADAGDTVIDMPRCVVWRLRAGPVNGGAAARLDAPRLKGTAPRASTPLD